MSFPLYPEYKESGVGWLGQVPVGWCLAPIKHFYKIIGGTTPKSDVDYYWNGSILWITPADLSKTSGFSLHDSDRKITNAGFNSCGLSLVPVGSIVLATRAPIGTLGIAMKPLCTNQGCKALVPSQDQNSRFMAYVLSVATEALNTRGRGTTFLELSGDELGAFITPIPSYAEQLSIANFLDHETAKIDALIAEQEKLIELLKEKRQAVISHAVTKGLDPNVKMKDSGVEWLGQVPEHWGVMPLRRVVGRIESGVSVNSIDEPVSEGEIGVLKTSCVYTHSFNYKENKKVVPEELERVSCPVTENTVIVSRMNTPDLVGAAGFVSMSLDNLFLPDRLWAVHFQGINPKFVYQWFCSNEYRSQVVISCAGTSSSMQNISQDSFLNFFLAVPSTQEQEEIGKFLDIALAQLDSLVDEVKKGVGLLQERRSALVSAAVTGQIDVRGLE